MQQSEKSLKMKKQDEKNQDILVAFTEKKKKNQTLLQQGVHNARAGLVNTANALFHHMPKAGRLAPGH